MAVNQDFRDMFSALSDAGAEYIVIGAHAVMYYVQPRYTKDIDIWVRPAPDNARCVLQALSRFGAPTIDLAEADLGCEGTIFQIGVEPNRIDLTTSIDGIQFDEAWRNRVASSYGGVPISILSRQDLITNKRASGRPQDLIDVQQLESSAREPE